MTAIETIRKHLEKYGQEHLIKFWDEIDDEQKKQLKQEIDELKFSELLSFYERVTKSETENAEKLDDKLQPIEESQFLSVRHTSLASIKEYESKGLEQISENHVGVLLMAGGQGTRLGFSHPKGMFDVGLPSKKSLFQIQAERIRTLQRLAFQQTGKNGRITWYIMTSEHTMEPTKAFFEQNNYFGLDADDVIMFEQGSLPCFGFDGKILLDKKHAISTAPDGNGGIYRALKSQGILDDMERRGVLYLHAHSVDNILIKVADPVFIGYCVLQNADCAAKVVEKSQPNEAVGVICMVDGKYQVVEYSEISAKTSELRNSDGRLTFNAGNICNHFFSTEFLNKIGNKYEQYMKLHVAKKKIPFIDNAGKRCTPEKPNGIKIEKFVFDVFEFAEKFVVFAVERDDEFSPLKNADSAGKECATTARNDIYRYHKKLIEAAGGQINGDVCEISPLLSYDGEGLKDIVGGQTFMAPIHLKSTEESNNITNGH
ncbi:UDP-N-acetylhexosamine pyrophosphorylase [Contarinia nasturtii]|uniref:UDP-N-acetylhexosamine pyrophosphorylase n=1 Tax=Contarinia nasturtii TaxID=265458 RepID=UPI0012D421A6|nr:UDP-N-acetylhexosamine pyrophosphorylase [Contarinia nasturtii]